jgi:hypothetical protein
MTGTIPRRNPTNQSHIAGVEGFMSYRTLIRFHRDKLLILLLAKTAHKYIESAVFIVRVVVTC